MRKKIIVISSLMILFVILFAITENIVHHDENKDVEIKRISYVNYLGEYGSWEYLEKEDIEKILKKLESINFYPVSESRLHESPTSAIYIETDNGKKKRYR